MNNNTPNYFIEKFKIELDNTKNKKFLIENEIKKIDSILYFSNDDDNIDPTDWNLPKNESIELLFSPDNSEYYQCSSIREVFREYQRTGKYIFIEGEIIQEEEFTESDYKMWKKINENKKREIEIIKKFTDYYNWLKKLDIKPITQKHKSKLTLNQKVLALHYLGLDLKKYDRTKSSNVLSQIIGEDESNTRKSLNYINSATKEDKVKNTQNLKKLIELFENKQFDKIKSEIKNDLEKVEVSS